MNSIYCASMYGRPVRRSRLYQHNFEHYVYVPKSIENNANIGSSAYKLLNQARAAFGWFLEIALVRASVWVCVSICLCVCPPPRPLITSGVIWCDIGCVQLVKQVLRIFPAFNYFIWHLPSIKWMGVTIIA